MEQLHDLKVRAIQFPLSDMLVLQLEPHPVLAAYEPGQHLTLLLQPGSRPLRRSYSLCSLPSDEFAQLAIQRVPNGEASRWLHQHLQPGSRLQSLPPAGRFTLQKARQHVFFAAGSGITPIYALIRQLLSSTPAQAELYYSEKSADTCLFYHEINQLQQQYADRLRIHWHFSQQVDQQTHFNQRLNQYVVEQAFKNHPQAHNIQFYLCGPMAYMRMIRICLRYLGYADEQIKRENFASEGIPMGQQSPARPEFEVEITLGKHSYRQSSHDTILQGARKNGIHLPYSCENGQCGTCTLQKRTGEVFHRINEVLTDKELAQGYLLSCTALPDSKVLII